MRSSAAVLSAHRSVFGKLHMLSYGLCLYQSCFLFSVLNDVLMSWGPCWLRIGCPSQSKLIPTDSQPTSCDCAFHMQTDQPQAHIPNHPLHLPLPVPNQQVACPVTPGPGQLNQTARDHSDIPEPPEVIQTIPS